MDLTSMTDEELSALRQHLAVEQDRRRKVAQLPDDLAAMACDAVAAGCSPDDLLDRLTDALEPAPEQETAP
ncbi:hypothetical protein [Brachybacterium tyrofermentans]|uniref:hypothetical protein n=1 Tax=Brachybacterium tyrofermentans TaxID=47848 RepID=UPI003FD1BA9C